MFKKYIHTSLRKEKWVSELMTFTPFVRLNKHMYLGDARVDFISPILAVHRRKVLDLGVAPTPRAKLCLLTAATSQDWGVGPCGTNPLPASQDLCSPAFSSIHTPHVCFLPLHVSPNSEPSWITPTYLDPSFTSYPFHTSISGL